MVRYVDTILGDGQKHPLPLLFHGALALANGPKKGETFFCKLKMLKLKCFFEEKKMEFPPSFDGKLARKINQLQTSKARGCQGV